MPTGYTAGVVDGELTTLRDFTLRCARAYGACVTMREESLSAPIPEEFQPDTYHAAAYAEARERLARVEAISLEEAAALMEEENRKVREAECISREKTQLVRDRVVSMLEKVRAWRPPAALDDLRDFMLQQLNETLRFDGSFLDEPTLATDPAVWLEEERKRARRHVLYTQKSYDDEIARVRERNVWLKALREALAEAEPVR